jgi:hypothetical protein
MNNKIYSLMALGAILFAAACSDNVSPISGSTSVPNMDNNLNIPQSPVLCSVMGVTDSLEALEKGCIWSPEMWGPTSGYRVRTGYDNGTNTSGIWYFKLDSTDLLLPSVEWPAAVSGYGAYDSLTFSQIIQVCNGSICGTANFTPVGDGLMYRGPEYGEWIKLPSVSVGFAMAGKDVSGKFEAVDASVLDGLCIGYQVESSIGVVLEFDDSVKTLMGDAYYQAVLSSWITEDGFGYNVQGERDECFAWSDFTAAYNIDGRTTNPPLISVEDAVKHLTGVKFEIIGGKNYDTEQFKISRIGRYVKTNKRKNLDEENLSVVDESCDSPVAVENFCECNYVDSIAVHEGSRVGYDQAFEEALSKLGERDMRLNLCVVNLRMQLGLEIPSSRTGHQPCDNAVSKILQCSDGSYRYSTEFSQVKSSYDAVFQSVVSERKRDVLRQIDSCVSNFPVAKPVYIDDVEYNYNGDLWRGLDSLSKVKTDEYAEDKSLFGSDAGKFYWDVDSAAGGKSVIEWPTEIGNEFEGDDLSALINECKGLCGTYKLERGSSEYNPYVDIGFYVAGHDCNGTALAADISDWGGICVSYQSKSEPLIMDVRPSLLLDLGDSLNQKLNMELPRVYMSESFLPDYSNGTMQCYGWNRFSIPWDSEYQITGEEAAKHVVKVIVRFQSETGTVAKFRIAAIGAMPRK